MVDVEEVLQSWAQSLGAPSPHPQFATLRLQRSRRRRKAAGAALAAAVLTGGLAGWVTASTRVKTGPAQIVEQRQQAVSPSLTVATTSPTTSPTASASATCDPGSTPVPSREPTRILSTVDASGRPSKIILNPLICSTNHTSGGALMEVSPTPTP